MIVAFQLCPSIGAMAGGTIRCRIKMATGFTAGLAIIMAALAIINNAGMIELGWQPCEGTVAVITICLGVDMIGWLAGGQAIAVTFLAVTTNNCVVHLSW